MTSRCLTLRRMLTHQLTSLINKLTDLMLHPFIRRFLCYYRKGLINVTFLLKTKSKHFENGVFWMPQIPFAFESECERPNDLCTAELPLGCLEMLCLFYWKQPNGNLARHFKIKIFIFLSVNGQIVIRMTCVQPNCHLAVHTQIQTQTQTEGYRMHLKMSRLW